MTRGNLLAVESEWTNVKSRDYARHVSVHPFANSQKDDSSPLFRSTTRWHVAIASSHAHHPVILSVDELLILEVIFTCVSSDTTAASKLKMTLRVVPTGAPTVTAADLNRSPTGFEMHVSVGDSVGEGWVQRWAAAIRAD